ncbi:hypothetical protein Hanom_Chr02g00165981 [Helianthus anomalus]
MGSTANMTPLTCAFANSILIFVQHDTNALMCDSGLNSTKNVIYHFQARFTIPNPLNQAHTRMKPLLGKEEKSQVAVVCNFSLY